MRRGSRAVTIALLGAAAAACGGGPDAEPVTVNVPAGAGLGEVTDSLLAHEVIGLGPLFRLYARLTGDDTRIRAGRYALRPGSSWGEVLTALTEGRVETERLTVPEGFTLRQMAPRIAAITGTDVDSVRAVLENDALAEELGVPGPTLEGYLFPDTYLVAPGISVQRVVEAMVDRYRRFWTPARRARLDSLDLDERQLVTLASIVQAEARQVEEMPTIAGVYRNRLDANHPLQADPTVLYALGGPRERLLYAAIDSVEDDPYNTYTQAGLPPGPISSPGALALEAALRPAETDYFYFVARPTGHHVFTRTLAEHNRAKAQARREWDTARAAVGTEGPAGSDAGGGP